MSAPIAAPPASQPFDLFGVRIPPRWVSAAIWLVPIVVAAGLAWTYADSYLRPSFAGDQGTRLDQADKIVVIMGPRRWLPFLQLHLHLLYLARVPVPVYLLVPFVYTLATLFLLAALCRATLRDDRQALVATALLLIGFGGSSFHWLGRSLYQETLLLPMFLGLVYLHYFAPHRRMLFLAVFAAGLLTREVFWIWWAAYLVLHWRARLRDPLLRYGMVALALIPAAWLVYTKQSLLLSRNLPSGEQMFHGIGGRAEILAGTLVSEWILPSVLLLALVFALVIRERGVRGLSFRSYHIYSLVSLAATYGYVLLYDPWQSTPGNTRALVPLFAHVLFWWVLAWREGWRLFGRVGTAVRIVTVVGMLTLLKMNAISATVQQQTPVKANNWEPLHLTTQLPSKGDWRNLLARIAEPLREQKGGTLEVAVLSDGSEYRKLWVAPFMYDHRTHIRPGDLVPPADLIIVPEGFARSGWVEREQLVVAPGTVRVVLTPSP